MRSTFDVQRITAKTSNYDILVASRTMADVQYSTNSDGTPQIKLLPGSNINYARGWSRQPAQLLCAVHSGPLGRQ